jgi:hypothetical protein
MKPYRSFVSLLTFNITYRTQFLTFSAAYALLLIHRKMLICNEVIMEETAKETAVQTRESALVKMLTTTTLTYPFREFVKSYGCIAYFLTFTEILVKIHERESDIALRHYNSIRGIEMQMRFLQMPLKELHCLTGTITTGTESVGIGALVIILQLDTGNELTHDAWHSPAMHREHESYLLTCLERKLTGRTVTQYVHNRDKSVTSLFGQLLCRPFAVTSC